MKKRKLWPTLVLVCIVFVYLAPIYVLVGIACKSQSDLSSYWHFPIPATLENFRQAIQEGRVFTAIGNTLVIACCSVVLIVLIGSLAAYPLAREKNRFTRGVRRFSLGIMMIPPLSILVPLYSTIVDFGGVNHYWGIVVTLVTFELPLGIFLYANFIEAIPKALDEAARIDGANAFQTFFLVVFPQLRPVTVSIVILSGIDCWNDYQFSLYILQKPSLYTITLAISSFFRQRSSNLNAAAAAALLVILPVVVAYLCLQKYFIKGMVDSAIK